jgi:endonuclease/exonuclease/phosphatase family metal-dependent hydrolase
MRVVNIYAPSGAAKRKEKDTFYNKELPAMLDTKPVELIGGDFNCVLEGSDTTGQGSYSRALAMLIKGFSLHDTCHQRPGCEVFTHHSVHGGKRLDRIYVTTDLLARKNVQMIATAFTDHFGVVETLTETDALIR